MKKHTALKQKLKNHTCIEFRRDVKAPTLLADTSFSGNLFHSWTMREKFPVFNPCSFLIWPSYASMRDLGMILR